MTPVVGVPASGLSADLPAPVGPATPVHPAPRRSGHPWAPASACGPACLPAPDMLPRVGHLRVAARLTGLVSLLLATALAAGVLPLLAARWRARLLRRLFRGVLRVVGVRLVHRGADRFDLGGEADGGATSGVLVVANHLSWLDILVLGAVQPLRMVAKREIRDWPVIGALAARVGTLFVDRAGLRELPTVVAQAADALRAGAVVGLFPEGTTWCGAAGGPFRRAGFQAALDAGVPVRPVAQRMRLPDGAPTCVGAFLGEDTLLDSLLRVVRLPELVLEVEVLPALPPEPGLDRRELARRAELAIASATGVPAASAVTEVRAAEAVPAAASATRPAAPRPADVSAAA
jgi:1-acyl-sn-glycerol-3-phosphate acyltransferase